jgi:hypothetical protein
VKFFIHNVAEEPLVFSELTVKGYKELLKATYGDSPSPEGFIETLYDILFALGNKTKEFYKELSVYQLFQIITEIRIQSLGNECTVKVTREDKSCNLHLDLEKILQDVQQTIKSFEEILIQEDGVKLSLKIPTPARLFSKSEEECLCFIDSFSAKNKTIPIQDNISAKTLIDKLSPKIALKLIQSYTDFVEKVTKENLLKRYGVTEQSLIFVPSVDSLIWFTKLYFNEPLDSFYETIFFLCHEGNFEASYIEKCTPGEYIFLAKKLVATIKEKNKAHENSQQES